MRNQISQLKNKIKEYEDGTEIPSLKKQIKEIDQQRNIYYKMFMESPYKCLDCDKSFTPETTSKKKSKRQTKAVEFESKI